MSKNVIQIVRSYLEENGYDGLIDDYGECGCLTDDLAPCGILGMSCKPAYRVDCKCAYHCGWHMSLVA